MTERFDLVSPRSYVTSNGETKSYFVKIGTAWPTKNGGFSLTFDALPLPAMNEGKVETRVLMMPPKPREDGQQASGYKAEKSQRRAPAFEGDDGPIPF